MILHVLAAGDWAAARAADEVRPPSIEREGFVHCSTAAQLPGVVERFYRDVEDLVVLVVDPDRVPAELRWEPPAHASDDPDERFPHVYGPLPISAVVRAQPWPEWRAGQGS